MSVLVEIDSEAFIISVRGGRLMAHQVRHGRDYPLYVIASIDPKTVHRALEKLLSTNAITWECADDFEQRYLRAA